MRAYRCRHRQAGGPSHLRSSDSRYSWAFLRWDRAGDGRKKRDLCSLAVWRYRKCRGGCFRRAARHSLSPWIDACSFSKLGKEGSQFQGKSR